MSRLFRSAKSDRIFPTVPAQTVPQVGALCWRKTRSGRKLMLVNSSRGRWILPKGWPMDDRSDAKAAMLEAWEEGGVEGTLTQKTPVALIHTLKRREDGSTTPVALSIYEMDVTAVLDTFPEDDRRTPRWVSPKQAANLVQDPELKAFLTNMKPPVAAA